MKKNTFKILYHIRGNYTNKDGKCPITVRIAVNGEYARINSTLAVEPELWDVKAGKAIGRSAKVLEINKRLEDMRVVLKEHYYDILNRHGYVTAEMVKNAFTGVTAKEGGLADLIKRRTSKCKKCIYFISIFNYY